MRMFLRARSSSQCLHESLLRNVVLHKRQGHFLFGQITRIEVTFSFKDLASLSTEKRHTTREETTHMGALHMWSTAGSKLDLFSATSELAPNRNIESKWPMAMHGAYHSRVPITIAQNEPLDRSSDHSILFVRIQDATLQPGKKRSEQARSLHR